MLREAAILDWLAGRLNVPGVVLTASSGEHEYTITRAVPDAPEKREFFEQLDEFF